MKRAFCIITLLCSFVLLHAQPVLTRTGSYVYVVPPDQTLETAKKIALERAKLQVIEDEYGTVVGMSSISRTSDINGNSSSSFLAIGGTEVKGEWIKTVGTPSFEMAFQGESMVIKVTVTGQIREIVSSTIDIDVKILRNGTSDKDESVVLKDGDDFFVYFKSPVKGYVAVYQYDSDGVFRLLPYSDSELSSIPVKAGKEYVFFNGNSNDGVSLRQDISTGSKEGSYYTITCSSVEDLCRYYIVFSPNGFSVANDETNTGNVSQLDFDSFQRWLARVRKQDKDMTVVCRDITLRNK